MRQETSGGMGAIKDCAIRYLSMHGGGHGYDGHGLRLAMNST
jgi:hypothetical protein